MPPALRVKRRLHDVFVSGLPILLFVVCNSESLASSPPETISLTGQIRDFHKTDSEFTTTPSAGNGHYAGNIATYLDSNQLPVFTGNGYKVDDQWRDQASRPIAPHLAFDPANLSDIVPIVLPEIINTGGMTDSFNAYLGAYGGKNVGDPPTFQIVSAASMPTITLPSDPGTWLGDEIYNSGTPVIDSNLHFDDLTITNGITLQIDGNVTIVVDDDLHIDGGATIELLPCATLTIFVSDDINILNGSIVNVDSADPARLSMLKIGTSSVLVDGSSHVYANLTSPLANLQISNDAHYYGSLIGKGLIVTTNGHFHFSPLPVLLCCDHIVDSPGEKGSDCNGGITSQTNFSTWFRDALERNQSVQHTIDLTRNFSGVYEYLDDDFHPIDSRVFGNEGQSHNNYFTYEISATFTYEACTNQFIEFMGTDDAWLFVNGELVMDLGGIVPGTQQVVDMDRLGLSDGQLQTVHFFYAQRQSSLAVFRLKTNIPLSNETPPITVSAAVD